MPPFSFLPAILLAALASGALILGAALPNAPLLRRHLFYHRLSLLIGFSAGLMLATALHDLIPEALEVNPHNAMWGAGAGFLILYFAERMTHFHACRHRDCAVEVEDEPDEEIAPLRADAGSTPAATHSHSHGHAHAPLNSHAPHGHADTMALVGMGIHNFSDGLTMAAALAVSGALGLVVVFAVVLHQMAAGVSVGAIMLRAGRSHRRVIASTATIAFCILLGALFYHFAIPVGPSSQGIILGLAGGSFLYVAACDLLPEAHSGDEGWSVTAATIGGYAFALFVKFLVPHAH
jgi:zinc transporter ZupT